MWEARHDVLDGGVLHVVAGRRDAFFGPEAKENGSVVHELWLFVDLF
jgi:hypothetical protein